MFQRLNEMRERREAGFTLIELMVVVLIIAILIAIAIPTFLGLRERAQDRAAQSDLRNGLTAAKAFYTDNQVYTGFDAAGVAAGIEPSLNWDAAGGPSITVEGAQVLVLELESESGKNFCIADNTTAGTARGGVDPSAPLATYAACNGAAIQW